MITGYSKLDKEIQQLLHKLVIYYGAHREMTVYKKCSYKNKFSTRKIICLAWITNLISDKEEKKLMQMNYQFEELNK
jgi:hypothetical protein